MSQRPDILHLGSGSLVMQHVCRGLNTMTPPISSLAKGFLVLRIYEELKAPYFSFFNLDSYLGHCCC